MAANAYPKATRWRLADRCQNRPRSIPPRSKNGSTISSQVSLRTFDGGGSVAPALRQSSSQTIRISVRTTIGGTIRTEIASERAASRIASGARRGVSARVVALVEVGSADMVSDLRTGMFIGVRLRIDGRAALCEQAVIRQTSTRLIDRLLRYAPGFAGSKTLPSKNVSLPREVEVGISAAGTPSVLAASRQRSSRFTFLMSALASKVGSNLPQRVSSVMNQRSWLWNG